MNVVLYEGLRWSVGGVSSSGAGKSSGHHRARRLRHVSWMVVSSCCLIRGVTRVEKLTTSPVSHSLFTHVVRLGHELLVAKLLAHVGNVLLDFAGLASVLFLDVDQALRGPW